MHQTTRCKTSNQCSTDDTLVKQEIVDEHALNHNESSSSAPCQSALKCEYDPDCGCKKCQFNKSRHIDRGAPQIKLECDEDETKVTIKTELMTKCVKDEIKEEDYCGCNECLGVGSSKQLDQKKAQIETDLPANEESVQPPTNDDQIINQDYGDIRDCPTPDYLPPFFSEDEEEEENEDESDDELNHQSNSRRSARVANKPQTMYREEYSESDNDNSEYEPTEIGDIDEETEIEDNEEETELEEDSNIVVENTTKFTQLESSSHAKNRTKKSKSSNKGIKRNEKSSDEVKIEALKKKKIRGKFLYKILILRLNCSECDETFKDSHSLNVHLHKRHKIFKFRCHVRGCSASFSHPPQFHCHQLAEHCQFTNKWPCALCPLEIFKSYKGLAYHVWKIHQEGQFRCAYEGCQFESHSTRTVLINHYLTSHNKTTFTCQFQNCGMIFPNKSSLNRHSKVHTGEKTFECEICKNRYRTNHILKRHQLGVHEVGNMAQYKCKWSKCRYSSNVRDNTICHIQRIHFKNGKHLDPKDFLEQKEITTKKAKQMKFRKEPKTILTLRLNCPVGDCSDHFPDKSQLLDHLSKCHQIERFRCIVGNCMASFQNRAQLTTHKKEAHKMLKVWHCGKCDYQGKTYELLLNHITNAHEEGHFACGHADCRFVTRFNRNELKKHQFKHRKTK